MAEIVMSYIIIKRENNCEENVQFKQKITEHLQKSGYIFEDQIIRVDNANKIHYELKNKKYSDRFYLIMKATMRINKGIESLQRLDECLFKSSFQKYANLMRDYDGISAELSQKLYPKYSLFERKLRQLILLVLTKSYGSAWRNETIPEKTMNELKATAKGNLTLTDTLEQFDLFQMEQFLFGKREIDYQAYLQEKLSTEQLKELDKESICTILEEMRPKSLWDRNFTNIGSVDEWESIIRDVHECRNKVAHHKRILQSEYKEVNQKLNLLNKKLSIIIEKIKDKDFTNQSAIDVLGNFAIVAFKTISNVFLNNNYSKILLGINSAIQSLVTPILKNYPENLSNSLTKIEKEIAQLQDSIGTTDSLMKRIGVYSNLQAEYTNLINNYNVSSVDMNAIEMANKINAMTKKLSNESEIEGIK